VRREKGELSNRMEKGTQLFSTARPGLAGEPLPIQSRSPSNRDPHPIAIPIQSRSPSNRDPHPSPQRKQGNSDRLHTTARERGRNDYRRGPVSKSTYFW
jgi:hypothetical protein